MFSVPQFLRGSLCWSHEAKPQKAVHNANRLRSLIFKWCVELNMMSHTIAAHFRTDEIYTRELRAFAVDEVKRTNGQVDFEDAVRRQRRIEPDDQWQGLF